MVFCTYKHHTSVNMTDNERIIENVNATMSMEGMPLTKEDRDLAARCLEGKLDFGDAIASLVKKYSQKPAVR